MPFRHVRAAYERLREQERQKLEAFLDKYLKDPKKNPAGLQVVTIGNPGKGAINFKPGGKDPAFDLRNWKWVEVTGPKGFDCVISLNMPAIAPDTGTPVACYDRVGLVLSSDPKDWVYTDIDLPLTNKKRRKIAQAILNQYKENKP